MRRRYRFSFLAVGCWLLFTLLLYGAAKPEAGEQGVVPGGGGAKSELASEGPSSAWAQKCIAWFQETISPIDAGRCQMYPTCSEYGRRAIAKHGLILGLIMTFDRLLHEYDEPRFAPQIVVGDRVRYYDPVSANDFWWYAGTD